MDSRLVRIFCANLPSQQARGASYNSLLSLRKGYLFRHRSWCYQLSSSSTSPESIKSLQKNHEFTPIDTNWCELVSIRGSYIGRPRCQSALRRIPSGVFSHGTGWIRQPDCYAGV